MTMYLYRKVRQAVTLAAAIAFFSLASRAQYRAPQPERKTLRAVGVLETFANGSRRLAPVTFFYERHYYDASFYHATPVPFTLAPETVYKVQQSGKAVGTFTVLSAVSTANLAAGQDVTQWFGNGRYRTTPDAVDPEGYGRYGLLFREQKRDGVSWLLGRTTGYELQTVFERAVR
jgi:hypothetical protein